MVKMAIVGVGAGAGVGAAYLLISPLDSQARAVLAALLLLGVFFGLVLLLIVYLVIRLNNNQSAARPADTVPMLAPAHPQSPVVIVTGGQVAAPPQPKQIADASAGWTDATQGAPMNVDALWSEVD